MTTFSKALRFVAALLTLVVCSCSPALAGTITVPNGQLVQTPHGEVQIVDTAPPSKAKLPTLVLLHGCTASIEWWNWLTPLLSTHRVIAIDLLGHGGSDRPNPHADTFGGYSMENQAAAVAAVLDQRHVAPTVVIGHSMGASVATALNANRPDLVTGLVIINQAVDNRQGSDGVLGYLTRKPVIGAAMWASQKCMPDCVLREGLSEAFAPGFKVPNELVAPMRRISHETYRQSAKAEDHYTGTMTLDKRLRDFTVKPLFVIFGEQDRLFNAHESLPQYGSIGNVGLRWIAGAGHSPHVERPDDVAQLIEDFLVEWRSRLNGAGVIVT